DALHLLFKNAVHQWSSRGHHHHEHEKHQRERNKKTCSRVRFFCRDDLTGWIHFDQSEIAHADASRQFPNDSGIEISALKAQLLDPFVENYSQPLANVVIGWAVGV